MKKIFLLLVSIAFLSSLFVGCQKDEWSNGDPALDHVYYFGFQDWGTFKNDISYDVARGDTVGIPVQFYSENPMSVDVNTYYYVSGDAVSGTDYEIVDKDGNKLTPDDNGAYTLTWPKAVKGVKDIYVKALSGGTATSLTVLTFDPNDPGGISYTHLVNDSTAEYKVLAFTQNYKVTVNIK